MKNISPVSCKGAGAAFGNAKLSVICYKAEAPTVIFTVAIQGQLNCVSGIAPVAVELAAIGALILTSDLRPPTPR